MRRPHPAPDPARGRGDRGFALVAVIWTLGLIVLLATALTVGHRYRTRAEAATAATAGVSLAAESGFELGVLLLTSAGERRNETFPLHCRLPDGSAVLVTVADEAGKIDLNTASRRTLARLLSRLSADAKSGEAVADAILAMRQAGAGNTGQTPNAPRGFSSILEFDRVPGATPQLVRAALPFLTVRSGRPEPDPALATPSLRALLELPAAAPQVAAVFGDVTIRTDARDGRGNRHVLDVLVSLQAANGRPYTVREWRQADAAAAPSLPDDAAPCLTAAGRD